MALIEYQLEKDGAAIITINRPDKLNALNQDVLLTMSQLLRQFEQDDTVKGIIITGNGKAFCAGADIEQLADINAEQGYQFAQFGQQVFSYIENYPKPIIAAVNGYAFGGGCELALSTHLRVASDKAQFGLPEIKLGVMPGYGGTQRLLRLIGKGRALDLCLTGRFIDAEIATMWGMVSDVATEDLLATAKQWLTILMNMPPLAYRSINDTIQRGGDMNMADALHLEAIHFAKLCATKDKQTGVAAFLQKQTPEFEGI